MAIKQLKDELLTGVEQFDEEHQGLFMLVEKLSEAMRKGTARSEMKNTLYELEKYSKTHFTHEEEFMVKIEFPALNEHIKEHLNFTYEIQKFKRDNEENQIGLSINLISFLKNWLLTHIKVKDKEYGDYARSKGFI